MRTLIPTKLATSFTFIAMCISPLIHTIKYDATLESISKFIFFI
ncbi:DUF2324 domain-containing protein, partial [Bacillus anthracis]|nr:DUF2324 domain-containing protein [Bacillus anthracis]